MAVRPAARQRAYRELVDRWRAIRDRAISKEAKQAECMSLLREFIDGMAWTRRYGFNIPLRFYADMLVLEDLLRPRFATDELGEIAIWPGHALVKEWLDEHCSGSYRSPRRISEVRSFTFE
jgi:hypothetical protein